MLCEACKKNEATVHTVSIVNGVKEEHFLCSECANTAQFKLPSLMDMLGGLYTAPQFLSDQLCHCGKSFSAFSKTGLLGCADCYKAYPSAVRNVIKRVQGGKLRHVGRTPANYTAASPASPVKDEVRKVSELERLKAELQSAVSEEKYERAAELRDRIKALESKEQNHE